MTAQEQADTEAYPVSELRKPQRRHAALPSGKLTKPRSSSKVAASPAGQQLPPPVASSVFPLTRIEKTPTWLVYNESVHAGYRRWDVTAGAAFRSLFMVHNETGNIWTHLLGLLGFASLGWHTLAHELPEAQPLEKLSIGVFFVGVITCVPKSPLLHARAQRR